MLLLIGFALLIICSSAKFCEHQVYYMTAIFQNLFSIATGYLNEKGIELNFRVS